MTAAVGADIESLCSKCGDVWHVVVAKVGDKIARVLCKQCGKEHRHKPPGAAVAAAAPRGGGGEGEGDEGAPTAAVKKKRAPAKAKAVKEPEGPAIAADLSKPVRPYRASEAFAPGERINHPTFGEGIAESSPGPGKIQVYFGSGRRILAQAKTESTLSRPGPPSGTPQKI